MEQKLQEYRQIIKDFMTTYVVDVDQDGCPNASMMDMMSLIDRAKVAINED